MNRLTRYAVLILIGLLTGLGAGCGKKIDTESAAADAAQKLPGADEVMAALEKKDYDKTLAALLKLKQTITTAEQGTQFMTVYGEVKIKLLDAAPNDPKAAEALSALRAMTLGR
jgi:hypothetical protein